MKSFFLVFTVLILSCINVFASVSDRNCLIKVRKHTADIVSQAEQIIYNSRILSSGKTLRLGSVNPIESELAVEGSKYILEAINDLKRGQLTSDKKSALKGLCANHLNLAATVY